MTVRLSDAESDTDDGCPVIIYCLTGRDSTHIKLNSNTTPPFERTEEKGHLCESTITDIIIIRHDLK